MNPILMQTFYYMVVLILALVILSFLQRGFFWKFFKVKVSFGKFVLVKIRSVNRDYYSVGRVRENFLVFKTAEGEKRISVLNSSYFYRSLGVAWVDVDDTKNAIVKTDYEATSGFDAVKMNNLYLRALYKPTIADTKERIIIGAIIVLAILVAVNLYLTYRGYNTIGLILQNLQGLKSNIAVANQGL